MLEVVRRGAALLALALLVACGRSSGPRSAAPAGKAPRADTGSVGTVQGQPERFRSACLGDEIVVLPGVFHPREAEQLVVPLLRDSADLFVGRHVLEIGTGSGVIGLCAARLGAARVVVTDINPQAVECATRNARALGLAQQVEARLVPESDPSAYSVVDADESFDVVISNPPYSLDLDAQRDTTVVDTGDLGLSIVRGLATHLRPSGVAILLYNSFFYHNVMVKFARQQGFDVRHQNPDLLSPWETEALFNAYLERLFASKRLDPHSFRFDWRQEELLLHAPTAPQPLLKDYPTGSYPGMIVIRNPQRSQ